MAEIEIRPEDATAAAGRVAAAAEGIQSEGSVFQSAAESVASSMRFASLHNALSELMEDLVSVPSAVSTNLKKVAQAGTAAVDGMVAVDRDGALTFRAADSNVVMF
ncbi:hypothetical protein [Leifsonia sp. 1010]|uniref:hypothetical protein n=1 Tax=Leifsonia sp. 1010 TaxID=2817769 RepID=UPI002856147F|nr:hypothetical protein [Leifsonia sp. 1010]MDR6612967.1 uncharacterized protein YukE [Leifsonia sp. 1010]